MFKSIHIFKISFTGKHIEEDIIFHLLSAWRNNGQILNEHFVIYKTDTGARFIIAETPEYHSLNKKWNNYYVIKWMNQLEISCTAIKFNYIGSTKEKDWNKEISTCKSLILFFNQNCLTSPLKCGTSFASIPLYYLPKTTDDFNYKNIIEWVDYMRAIHVLWNSDLGNSKYLTNEMENLDSNLNQKGVHITRQIEQLTGIPTYYYLHHYTYKTSLKKELSRQLGLNKLSTTKLDLANEYFQLINKEERIVSNITPQLLETARSHHT